MNIHRLEVVKCTQCKHYEQVVVNQLTQSIRSATPDYCTQCRADRARQKEIARLSPSFTKFKGYNAYRRNK